MPKQNTLLFLTYKGYIERAEELFGVSAYTGDTL